MLLHDVVLVDSRRLTHHHATIRIAGGGPRRQHHQCRRTAGLLESSLEFVGSPLSHFYFMIGSMPHVKCFEVCCSKSQLADGDQLEQLFYLVRMKARSCKQARKKLFRWQTRNFKSMPRTTISWTRTAIRVFQRVLGLTEPASSPPPKICLQWRTDRLRSLPLIEYYSKYLVVLGDMDTCKLLKYEITVSIVVVISRL